ncbi:hypothetical protein HYC85_007365 [Camellia sinensis]|uniref:Protein phosphatase n=1 Tax=Camellia sinensis TaxID=4442 RepID=A0A7J7HPB5_CAMSI|nr:hypothetical protein HYC85_007365 [Camellia sinensis]
MSWSRKMNWTGSLSLMQAGLLRMGVFYSERRLKIEAGSLYLPKDDELKPRGDDAHFIYTKKQTIGLADGVGGWTWRGVDAGKYAQQLMTNSLIAFHNQPKGAVNPKMILRVINIGDSGFMLIRHGKVIYHSRVQQRSFNCPYQLGNTKDHPSLATELEVEVEEDDIVVVGTDGLLDNLHESEIKEIINHGPRQLACLLANLALYNSFDKKADTPFAQATRKAGYSCIGGKVDDITVIVALKKNSENDIHSGRYDFVLEAAMDDGQCNA